MQKKRMRKFKWFWAWQDEAEEEWLREMSNNGGTLQGSVSRLYILLKLVNPGTSSTAWITARTTRWIKGITCSSSAMRVGKR